MTGPERRPDLVGAAFGAFVVLALLAVVVRVTVLDGFSGPGPAVPTVFAVGERSVTAAPEGPRVLAGQAGGLGPPVPMGPLYYDGPRELVPAAAHEPAEVSIPKLGVASPLLRLNKRPDNTMEVPGDFDLAGWYVRGPAPGQVGPAVIVGHLDSRNGPAIFARLDELVPGDGVLVRRGDGELVRFVVQRVERYDKRAFPTAQVYGNTTGPELRLITCDGDFDRSRRSYQRNLVVYAVADPDAPPPPTTQPDGSWVEHTEPSS